MVNQKIKIVLIEDDLALGSLILELLILNDFNVEWFKDGAEALVHLQKNVPDIIISDFMMPNMNGEELFLKIRKDNRYQDVPFVIVTANIEEGVKFRHLKNGVNDYILKPFKVKELIYKIKNLIDFKLNIQKKQRPDPFSKVTIQLSQKDFISSVNAILCENLKSKIDLDQLSEKLYISRSTLDKKIRKLTKKNVTNYIRDFRLEFAVKLIDLGERNIQFLAEETGFNSLSYFSSSFKSYTGMTPTTYVKSISK